MVAVSRVLRPLVHLMMNYGIGYPALQELIKQAYVDVADKGFQLEGKSQTDSRISLLTGVHRKDVKRLRQTGGEPDLEPASRVPLGAQLVALWVGDQRYLNDAGKPKPLPRKSRSDGDLSFESLVASISKDIRSRVVLDEWLSIGVAHLDEQGCVCLNTDAFVPSNGLDEKAFYFGQNVHDHMAAAAHNVAGSGQPFLERSVHYDGLSPESVAELAKLAEEHGMQALHALNRRAMELAERDRGKGEALQRMNFGIYFFNEKASGSGDEEGQA